MGSVFEVVDDVPVDDVGEPGTQGFGLPLAPSLFNLQGQLVKGFLSDLLGFLRRQPTSGTVVENWSSVGGRELLPSFVVREILGCIEPMGVGGWSFDHKNTEIVELFSCLTSVGDGVACRKNAFDAFYFVTR